MPSQSSRRFWHILSTSHFNLISRNYTEVNEFPRLNKWGALRLIERASSPTSAFSMRIA